ncbi:SurA N-terminal domain-containing protein [Stappia sp. F7233]|uniref:Parvulin-like PPIase n=1 Tax=Stappia albiluteola TaxID=2758565 RepID=A0A839AAE4_9HYPH|nr:peptidylprolyl isomerase [Stappia albiluteola]MBA5776543.1 SurA N-terminal domain-containing protein [Stappia albiluteola]
MLDKLRSGAKSWLAKLLMILLVLSFAVWGISGSVLNGSSSNVAEVGGQNISLIDFDNAYRRRLDALGRQLGRPLSTTEGAALGIPGQVLGQLIAEAALNEAADNMNIGLSDEELRNVIQRDPSFQGPGGGFDRSRLAQLLAANQVSEDEFVDQRRELAKRQQLAEALAGAMPAPVAMVEALNLHGQEARTVRYLDLAGELAGEIADPDDAALAAWFDEHRSEFKAPEYRSIKVLEVTPEAISRPEAVSAEAVRDAYDRAGNRFGEPERRRILQISFPSAEEANAAAAAMAGGKSFEDVLAERSLAEKDVDLGTLTRADLLDPTIAESAFSLAEGETSGVVDGRFSPVILKVTAVSPAHTRAFEEVEGELRAELALRDAEREVLDLHDEVEDARAGGATLEEVASRFDLSVKPIGPFDRNGAGTDGKPVTLPETRDLLSEVFESDIGVENDPLQLGRRGFIWFDVSEVTPERDRELSEVRDQVLARWREEERAMKLAEISAKAKQDLDGGKTLDAIASELGLEVKTSEAFTRGQAPGDLTTEAVSAAFSGPAGTSADVAGKDGHRLLVVVDTISTPAFFAEAAETTQLRDRLSQGLQDSIIGQYVGDIEDKAGVSVNQAAVSQVIGLGSGG